MKAVKVKPPQKSEREKEVLIGLIEAFLESGKPIGSNTLKESGFDHFSAATIRNYFSKLESEGFLEQQHSSGGRIPTEKAFRFYAHAFLNDHTIHPGPLKEIESISSVETKEVAFLIRKAMESLSLLTESVAFISTPKFDQDFVTNLKLLPLDSKRILLVLMTDFGSVHTEVLMTDQKISGFSAKRMEAYLHHRLTGQDKPIEITPEEESLANRFYNEAIVRFFVGYSNFSQEEIQKTGFSRLLKYPEFYDPALLTEALALFENETSLRHILRNAASHEELKIWIGEDLLPFGAKSKDTAILAIPYFINAQAAGAIGILGPKRIPYRKLYGIIKSMSQALTKALTANLYKFQLTYRQPGRVQILIPDAQVLRIGHQPLPLIENKKGYLT